MNKVCCCLAGRLLLPLLLLGGNVKAMDARGAPAGGDSDWSIVSAPPPPGPYRPVNIDPRIPDQNALSVPAAGDAVRASGRLPEGVLSMPPPAAGGVAPEAVTPGDELSHGQAYYKRPPGTGGYNTPTRPYDPVPSPGQTDYAPQPQSRGYAPPGPYDYGQPGGYAPPGPYDPAQPGGSAGYRPAPYAREYGRAGQGFEPRPYSEDFVPPPGAQPDFIRQSVPGPYDRGMQRPPAYNYPEPDHYAGQPEQQGYRTMPPPGYYSPSTTQRPLQDAPQPPIYDSMMGKPSGSSVVEDASAGVPR